MVLGPKRRLRLRLGAGAVLATALALCAGAGDAGAASPPTILEAFSSQVGSTSARLSARINPGAAATTYRVDYIAASAYEANLAAAREGFSGAQRSPAGSEAAIGFGSTPVSASQQLFSLAPETAYRYRFVAHNSQGTVELGPLGFATEPAGGGATLADGRGWELVSPVEKNGGQVATPGAAAGGAFQAAAAGGAIAYASAASFGAPVGGAPPLSQYLASRSASGWSTANLTAPLYSGSYDFATAGDPYRLFSGDLARALLLNGEHCRGEGTSCAVANPPLAGTDAPEGYQDYYLREGAADTALLGNANAGYLALAPKDFDLTLAGASPDLRHVVLSSCAALSANATEVPAGEGCEADTQNLYEYSPGAGLTLVNLLPGQSTGTPLARLAAAAGAVSEDGSRVYFTDGITLYLREGATTREVAPGATFQAAAANGAAAFYTKAGHLYRYEAAGAGASTDLTPAGGVAGVLGASEDGATVYYQGAAGIERWHSGTTTQVAAGAAAAAASDYPPATGTARVSADGAEALFLSTEPLSGYDNTDLATGSPDTEAFLYSAASGLTCVSCNPTGERPLGPSTVPGAIPNGPTQAYKPRALSADGRRAFFDSEDALVPADTDNAPDAYEWEATGEGSCARAGGCASLISGGRAAGGSFVDASADGADAFLLSEESLVGPDPGGADLYDARVGGGFPEASKPIACEGDACQPLPSAPTDPTLDTLLTGPGNPAVRYPGLKCRKGQVARKGVCVKKKSKKAKRHAQKKRHRERGRGR